MKKKANELKKGDKIKYLGNVYTVKEMELSDIGKQGTKKCRLVLESNDGKETVIIRPEDYPFELV